MLHKVRSFLKPIQDEFVSNNGFLTEEDLASVVTNKTTLDDMPCATNQIVEFNGTQWICVDTPSELKFYFVEGTTVHIEYGVATHSIATCDANDKVLTGGFETVSSSGNYNVFPNTSKKLFNGEAWVVNFASNSANSGEWGDVRAIATCVDLEPFRP